MNSYTDTFSSILVIVALISFISFLRHIGLFKQEDSGLFAKIILNITLPAVVFSILSHSKTLVPEYLLIALFILISEVILLFLAWLIGKRLNISDAQLGTLMLSSAFGSSTLLGYVFIGQIFPSNEKALFEAVILSEIGVGIGFFTIGTMVAIYFGNSSSQKQTPLQSMIVFLKSPLFLSIIAGAIYSLSGLPTQGLFFKEFFSAIEIVAKSNTFFVMLIVGVSLRFNGISSILSLISVAVVLKLLLAPLLIWFSVVSTMNLTPLQIEVAVLETAMPTAMMTVALAAKYGCDAQLASKLIFVSTIVSIVTITLITTLLVS
ncbi:MAG: AEC family transporter [Campylobacterota bacterium]|nr:AEC family transporter [Campylobacterota bacterium]